MNIYKSYAIGTHCNFTYVGTVQSVITTWETYELAEWKPY